MNVVLVAAISADGYIARHKNELADWTTKEDKQYFVRRTKELGVMIMGRTTFQTIGRALPGRRMIVMTRSPDKYAADNVEFTDLQPVQLLKQLESEAVESVAVVGGARIYTEFATAGLLDELDLSIVDIELGDGIELFDQNVELGLDYESGEYLSDTVAVHVFTVS